MIKWVIDKWESNNGLLEKFFKENDQSLYALDYPNFFNIVIEKVINHGCDCEHEQYDVEKLTVLDHGDYQGTKIFIIPKKAYQPSVEDYLFSHNYYGSCSGCDTLQGIHDYDHDKKPNEQQVKDYMKLALHLVQNMKALGND